MVRARGRQRAFPVVGWASTALCRHLETLAEVLFLLLLFGPVERGLHHLVFWVRGLTLEPDSLKVCLKMLGSFQRVFECVCMWGGGENIQNK